MSAMHRLLLKWARMLHVYLTLFGFALLLFFAVTGFMLNHENWFIPSEPYRTSAEGVIPQRLLDPVEKLAVVELLRKEYGARGELITFEEESEEFRVIFKAPGRLVEAVIQREDGRVEVMTETNGIVGLLLDLHRGKDSGLVWAVVIDGTSVLFVLVSVTGLVLWSSLKSRARYGLVVLALGAAASVVVYFAAVPR